MPGTRFWVFLRSTTSEMLETTPWLSLLHVYGHRETRSFNGSVWLHSNVKRWGHVIYSTIWDILDLQSVRIDTKIKFVLCLQPEIRAVTQKWGWPWSQAMKLEFFVITVGFLCPVNISLRGIFETFGRKNKTRGMVPPSSTIQVSEIP